MRNSILALPLLALASCAPKAECSDLSALGAHLESGRCVVDGDLELGGDEWRALPENLLVRGRLEIKGTRIRKLPRGLVVEKDLSLFKTSIGELPPDLVVNGYFDNYLGFGSPSLKRPPTVVIKGRCPGCPLHRAAAPEPEKREGGKPEMSNELFAKVRALKGVVFGAVERCDVGKLEALGASGELTLFIEHESPRLMGSLFSHCRAADFCRLVPTMAAAGLDPWEDKPSSDSLLITAIRGKSTTQALCLIDHGPVPGASATADLARGFAREQAELAGEHAVLRRLEGDRPDDELPPVDLVRYDAAGALKARLAKLSAPERNRLLLMAVAYRSQRALRLLLRNGADPRFGGRTERFVGPPLVLAARRGNVEAAKVLSKAGARPDAGAALRATFEASISIDLQLDLVRVLLAAGVTRTDRAAALELFKARYGVESVEAAREHDRHFGGTFYTEVFRLLDRR